MLHLPGKFKHQFFYEYEGLVTLELVTHISWELEPPSYDTWLSGG